MVEGATMEAGTTPASRPATRDAGLWSRETRMIPQGFARLAQSLHSGGFIARMPGYDECVEPTLNGIQP